MSYQQEKANAMKTLTGWLGSGSPEDAEIALYLLTKAWSLFMPALPGHVIVRGIANGLLHEDGSLKSSTQDAAVEVVHLLQFYAKTL